MSSTSKTIPQLGAAGTLTGSEVVHIVQDGQSVSVPLSALAAYIKVAEVIVPASEPFKGVLLERTSDLNGVSWPAIIPWQQAVYDTDSAWSAGAATRITIAAGWTKVRLVAATRLNNVNPPLAGSTTGRIQKNGTEFKFSLHQVIREGTVGFTDNLTWAWTPVIPVIAGDYFEFRVNISGMAGVDGVLHAYSTFFALEVIEHA